MRAARLIAVIVCGVAVLAAEKQETKSRVLLLPPELQSIYGLAMAAPPEFAADALLKIAASSHVKDRDTKRELVDQAFRFAGRAQNPYELVSVPGTGTDTRSGFLANALHLRLDALSLQARAIVGMLGFDKKAAIAAMSSLQHPALDPLTCEDALIPDVSGYYAALGAVAEQAFSDDRDERTRFLLAAISRMTSSAEVSPMARLLLAAQLTPEDQQAIFSAFAARLTALPVDARTFGFYARYIRHDLDALAERAGQQREGGGGAVSAIFKEYLDNQAGGHCYQPGDVNVSGEAKDQDAGKPKVEQYWQTDAAKRVFEACLKLRFRPNGRLLEDAERATPEWGRELTDFLASLDEWRPQDEASEADYYHQRTIVYEALVELTPAGPLRDKLLQSYIAFITNSNLQQQSPVEWFWHADSLLDRMRNAGAGASILAA
jgi:hypothetical protein